MIFIFLFLSIELPSQNPCKKIIISACIDGDSKLHIKNGTLFWEHIKNDPPGTHFACGSIGITKVNGSEWLNWKSPYKLSFNTNGLTVQATIIYKNDISKIIQRPSSSNNWETIWYFSDPSGSSHGYEVSFVFCPPDISSEPKEKNEEIKKDSVKSIISETKPKTEEIKENVVLKVFFEPGKNVLTRNSENELQKLCGKLNKHYIPIEISGFTTNSEANGLKLYEDRSITINDFLLKAGIDQKRIKYIGFGDNEKKVVEEKKVKCFIIIN